MRGGFQDLLGAKIARAAVLCAVAIGLCGCWPWHHSGPTPQEQYLHALSSGQSAQASQIWLNMSPQDRIRWDTSQGLKPSASPQEIQSQVMKHYQEQMNGQAGAQTGDHEESIENAAPDLGGGGLGTLPKLATPPPRETPPDSN
jgi:hypothetical protein